jgi:ATP-dependent RNA helicase RhlB
MKKNSDIATKSSQNPTVDSSVESKNTATPSKSSRPRNNQRQRNKKHEWDPSKFKVAPQQGKTRFHDFKLPPQLMRAIQDAEFKYCTPIQAASLPYSLRGHDIIGKAQTGTGKTAAFLISMITDLVNHPIDEERYMGETRAMIMAPTRELAIQVADDASQLSKYLNLKVHCLVGGMDYNKQLKKLEKHPCDILVGTPGRIVDFANNRDIFLDQVEMLVIDEADRMLDMGFIPQVRQIVHMTPKRENRQTLLFSATFTPQVLRLSQSWTHNTVTVETDIDQVTTKNVEQKVYITTTDEKFSLLHNILTGEDIRSVMIFANRRDICRDLHEKLKKLGFKVGLLSGDIPQNRRIKALNSFKSGALQVVVTTDVAGRGIHIDGVSHVINFTLPEKPEDYVHRIGRTGRAGEKGISISFACEDDAFLLEPIEALLNMKLPCTIPDESLLQIP